MIHVALWATTLAIGAVVAAVPGLSASTRDALGLALEPHPGSLGQAASILFTNARAVAFILVAGLVVAHVRWLARPLDAWVALTLALNATLVGAALGAYGRTALPWLVHLPLEWTALAISATEYLRVRKGDDRLRARRAAVVLVLLVIAAGLESYATPQQA